MKTVPRSPSYDRPGRYPRPALPRPPRSQVEADVLEGLEQIAAEELEDVLGVRAEPHPNRPGALRFGYGGEVRALTELRTVLAVYLAHTFEIPRPKALLGNTEFGEVARMVEAALELAAPGAFGTLRLSAAGEESSVLTRFKEQLAQRFGLEIAPDEGDLLVRLRRAADGPGWEVLVRLTPRPLATRPWRVCNLPGSLNATLAHAIARLTEPDPDDTVLNIGCGAGTILIERLLLAPARRAVGCDTDAAALDCARQNLAAAGLVRAARLEPWDATALPLPDESVDVIVADLPFGQLVGSHRENLELYPRVLAEAARVARPGARMALLTHEVRLLQEVAASFEDEWEPVEVFRVRSGGMTPRIVLFERY